MTNPPSSSGETSSLELQVVKNGGETLLRLQPNGNCTVMQMATQTILLYADKQEIDQATLGPYDTWSIIVSGDTAQLRVQRHRPGSMFDLVDYRELFLDYPVVEEWYHERVAPVQPIETIKYMEIHRMPTELSVWVYFTNHPQSVAYKTFLIGEERTAPPGAML